MEQNVITAAVVDAAIKVHRLLGPGLLESIYEEVLHHELLQRGFTCERQKALPVYYDTLKMEVGFRVDLIVEHKIIVELKSVESVTPVFKKILLTYLRLSKLQIGLLINFNEEMLKNGITRLYNKEAL